MTTRKELGEMLITGKQMEVGTRSDGWVEVSDTSVFDVGNYTYRLKPTITYYRVYSYIPPGESTRIRAVRSDEPFTFFLGWAGVYPDETEGEFQLIHDFEKES